MAGEWSPITPLDEEQIINTSVNEGEASANAKGTTIYFTKCPQDKKKVYCFTYIKHREKVNHGAYPNSLSWGDSFNYVHPISDDELTIYFCID